MKNIIHHHEGPTAHPETVMVEIGQKPDFHRLLTAGAQAAGMLMEAHNEARIDNKTELPNAKAFEETFYQVMEEVADDPDPNVAMLFIDMDNFKEVNDTHGHYVGDDTLSVSASVASHILKLREGEMLARFGGDEFVAIIRTVDRDGDSKSPEEAKSAIEDRFNEASDEMAKILDIPGFGFSVGYVKFRDEGHEKETPEQFKKRADDEGYKRKATRKALAEYEHFEVEIEQDGKFSDALVGHLESTNSGIPAEKEIEFNGKKYNVANTNNLAHTFFAWAKQQKKKNGSPVYNGKFFDRSQPYVQDNLQIPEEFADAFAVFARDYPKMTEYLLDTNPQSKGPLKNEHNGRMIFSEALFDVAAPIVWNSGIKTTPFDLVK